MKLYSSYLASSASLEPTEGTSTSFTASSSQCEQTECEDRAAEEPEDEPVSVVASGDGEIDLASNSKMQVSSDPATWIINDTTIDYLLSNEIKQNIIDFSSTKTFYPAVKKFRSLTKNMFQRKLINGETQERKYLVYSSSKKALFCIACRLFDGNSQLATTG